MAGQSLAGQYAQPCNAPYLVTQNGPRARPTAASGSSSASAIYRNLTLHGLSGQAFTASRHPPEACLPAPVLRFQDLASFRTARRHTIVDRTFATHMPVIRTKHVFWLS